MTRKNQSDGSHLDIQGSVSGLSMWISIKDVPVPLSVCGRQYGAVRPYLRWPSLFGIEAGHRDFVKRARFLPTGDLRVKEETSAFQESRGTRHGIYIIQDLVDFDTVSGTAEWS